MQILKESMNTPQDQYPPTLDTNPVALQQPLSKIKAEIRHLSRRNTQMPTPLLLEITKAILIPHGNNHFCLPIKLTISIKLGLTSQVNTRIIVT